MTCIVAILPLIPRPRPPPPSRSSTRSLHKRNAAKQAAEDKQAAETARREAEDPTVFADMPMLDDDDDDDDDESGGEGGGADT